LGFVAVFLWRKINFLLRFIAKRLKIWLPLTKILLLGHVRAYIVDGNENSEQLSS